MESPLPIDHKVSRGQPQHHHVPKIFSLPDTTPKEVESQIQQQQQPCGQQRPKSIIQLVRRGEGKDILNLSNFVSQNDESRTKKRFSLHRPILVRDTPESIGMKIPKGRSRKRKRTMSTSEMTGNDNNGEGKEDSAAFSVRDVADAVGHSSPVQVIDVLSQELDKDLDDWTFLDLVEYFEDEERLTRSKPSLDTSPLPVSPTTGRSRRKAAIQSEKCFTAMIHQEKSTGEASKRILNQISYEFSGTPLHSMVRSPKIVRDIDWIDQAWPAERKPRKSEANQKELDQNNTNMQKKASKGMNSYEYPVVQYYCLTSSAGSYTDFHIDFGGSSVWYHVVRGEKIFVISPPTLQNLKVYEEWLCHPDQAKTFLPDLMKERACPDIHRYSSGDVFSSTSSVSTNSSASTYASSAALGDLADEMAFFRNSLKNTLSTNNSLRFTLRAGETLLLPAGWIHAVYTPVDSLVFGGNFLHGLDINLQLTVNSIEARSGVLDQYRFPHFGALQMYAGGMYLKRLKRMGKTEEKQKEEDGTKPNLEGCEPISLRELEELPMLMNALEFWWLTKNDAENGEKIANARDFRNFDSITSQASFRDAALHVAKQNGCDSVEEFIAIFRNEYARIASKQWGSYRVAPSDDPIGQFTSQSTLSVPLSSLPIAIGKPKKKPTTNRKSKPRHKRNRKGTTEMDDPLDVVLSKDVKEFLASIQITTAAQLLLAKTTDVAKEFPKWREEKGMSELKGKAGAQASVSVWKRKVRLRAAMVGATKLAQINVGTNTKKIELNDGQSLELNETRK